MKEFLIVFLALAVIGSVLLLASPGQRRNLGIAVNDIQYNNVTNSTTTCGNISQGSKGTVLAATSTSRANFRLDNTSVNTVYLCKDGSCADRAGTQLSPTGTAGYFYEQEDNYTGPYTCGGYGATNTVSYFLKQ